LAIIAALAPVLALPMAASASVVPQSTVVSAAPSTNTPNVGSGRIEDITQAGGRTFLGGEFTSVTSARSTTVLTRNRVLAFDGTGTVDDVHHRIHESYLAAFK